LAQQFHLLRIYPKKINKGVLRGSVSYRLPPVESSAALTTGEDGSQMSAELYGILDDALLSEKSIQTA